MHAVASVQWGEQAGRQVSPVHTPDAQSVVAPQATPGTQEGAHAGDAHKWAVQIAEAQSELAPQAAWSAHEGAHVGGWHALVVLQIPEAQSPFAPQGFVSGHAGEHAGATQTSDPLQTPDPQSAFTPHVWPSTQLGEHAGVFAGSGEGLVETRMPTAPSFETTWMPSQAPHVPPVHVRVPSEQNV